MKSTEAQLKPENQLGTIMNHLKPAFYCRFEANGLKSAWVNEVLLTRAYLTCYFYIYRYITDVSSNIFAIKYYIVHIQ